MISFFWNLLLRLTLGGSLSVLLLFVSRALVKKRVPARWRRLTSAGVLLFFLVPFSILPDFVSMPQMPQPAVTVGNPGETFVSPIPAPFDLPASPLPIDPRGPLLAIWAGGALLLAAYHLANWNRFLHAFQSSAQEPVQEAKTLYHKIGADMGLHRLPPLSQCPGVGAPMLAGLLKPRLLLPDPIPTESTLSLVLRHELIHYKSGDVLLKWLALTVSILHWWNPLAYLPGRLLEDDCEFACDEKLVRLLDAPGRKLYGSAILDLMSRNHTPFSSAFSRRGSAMKDRLEAILHANPRPLRGVAVCVTAIFLASSLLASSALAKALPLEDSDVGIIGGADGPTAIFVTPQWTAETVNPQPDDSHEAPESTLPLSLPVPEGIIMPGNEFQGYFGHTGVDYAAPQGTDILAAADGTVTSARYGTAGYGNRLILDHGNSLQTLYAHCNTLLVDAGDTVKRGQVIATVGRTGNADKYQCHFEVRQNGSPVDPLPYLESQSDTWDLTQPTLDPPGKSPQSPTEPFSLSMPTNGRLSTGYQSFAGHMGADFNAPGGDILAAANGVASAIGTADDGSQWITVDHGNSITTLYSLCSNFTVKPGEVVTQGQKLAELDTSGAWQPHLHFEVHLDGQPVDPEQYLNP